jgi:hypothetical protein
MVHLERGLRYCLQSTLNKIRTYSKMLLNRNKTYKAHISYSPRKHFSSLEPFLLILTAFCTIRKRQQTMPRRRAKCPETYFRTLNTSITSSLIGSGNCCGLDFRRGEHHGIGKHPQHLRFGLLRRRGTSSRTLHWNHREFSSEEYVHDVNA